jgi:hypothetical protein
MWLEGLGTLKNPPHRDLNLRPSGLQHNASTNYATAYPIYFIGVWDNPHHVLFMYK